MGEVRIQHYIQFTTVMRGHHPKEGGIIFTEGYGDRSVESRDPENVNIGISIFSINEETRGFRFYDRKEYTDKDGDVLRGDPMNFSKEYDIGILKDRVKRQLEEGLESNVF